MNLIEKIKKANNWIEINSKDKYIPMPKSKDPYFEVTGYFVPTLMKLGFKDKAKDFCETLIVNQGKDGNWQNRAFDTAQVLDGLSEFNCYSKNIEKGINYIKSIYKIDEFHDKNLKSTAIPNYINFRVLSVLKKLGQNIDYYNKFIKKYDFCDFSHVSHFYAYAFEGRIELNLNVNYFLNTAKKYNGIIPCMPNNEKEYCYTGLSQTAMCLFMLDEFDLGMNTLKFVSQFQNESGGFLGGTQNCNYFPNHELSWAVKFYIDAFLEAQKCLFRKQRKSWKTSFENGSSDSRFNFIKSNILFNDKVLEVGCGAGRYINQLNCNRHACDLVDLKDKINGEFKIASCLNLPYEDESFDKVFCCECLEHVIFKENAINEMLRILKKSGSLLIVDKNNKFQEKYKLEFCEEWPDFELIKEKYKAEITELDFDKMPFIGAIIKK